MSPWIINTIGILAISILVQLNCLLGYYVLRSYKHVKASDRFVKVENIADLYGLDNPDVFVPQAPPSVPSNWGWNDGDN